MCWLKITAISKLPGLNYNFNSNTMITEFTKSLVKVNLDFFRLLKSCTNQDLTRIASIDVVDGNLMLYQHHSGWLGEWMEVIQTKASNTWIFTNLPGRSHLLGRCGGLSAGGWRRRGFYAADPTHRGWRTIPKCRSGSPDLVEGKRGSGAECDSNENQSLQMQMIAVPRARSNNQSSDIWTATNVHRITR